MFKSVLKTSLRYLKKHVSYVSLNIVGLVLGILTSIVIFLFIQNELSYDSFYDNADKIYRLETNDSNQGQSDRWAATQSAMFIYIKDRYPEIKEATRLYNWFLPIIVSHNDETRFTENEFFFADSTFFNLFSYKVIEGSLEGALSRPENIVLTEKVAKKFFGSEPALGKKLDTDFSSFIVSAVIEDIPINAHFHFDLLSSMESVKALWPNIDAARNNGMYTYMLIEDKKSVENLVAKMNTDAAAIYGVTDDDIQEGVELRFICQNIRDIHLRGHAEKEIEPNGDISLIYIFLTVGLLVLIVASINYMNLATAQSFNRAKEVGVRKIIGAFRTNIFSQFMGESFLVILTSVIFSVILGLAVLPLINNFIDKDLVMNPFANIQLLLLLIGIVLIVGFLSGSYPAIFLSRFNSLRIVKSGGVGNSGSGAIGLRKVLVVFQFSMSAILIVGALIIYSQLKFIRVRDAGFNREDVICVDLANRDVGSDTDMLSEEISKLNNVVSVGSSFEVPGQRVQVLACGIPSLTNPDVEDATANDNNLVNIRTATVDEGMLRTLGYTMTEGRWFSKEYPSDDPGGFVFNETAIRDFGIEDPIGKTIIFPFADPPIEGTLIGVVKDYNYASVHNVVEPLMMMTGNRFRYLNIKIGPKNQSETISLIRNRWTELKPEVPFDYRFLEDIYDSMYRSEERMGLVISSFTLLAIVISIFGLFGLASYISERRTREIGIRKVYGASIKELIISLNREFVLLVIIANLIAWYPTYFFLNKWLQGFAYKVTFNPLVFVLSLCLTMLLAIGTVSIRTFISARINPAQSLKYE